MEKILDCTEWLYEGDTFQSRIMPNKMYYNHKKRLSNRLTFLILNQFNYPNQYDNRLHK